MKVYDTALAGSRHGAWIAVALIALLAAGPALAAGAQEDPVEEARARFRQALEAAREGRLDQARALALEGLEIRPEDADGRNLLGEILERLGDLDGALEAYGRAAEADPGWAMPLRNLGRLHLEHERYAAATAPLARAVEIEPENAMLRALLGTAYRGGGRPTAALEAFETAWGMAPDSVDLAIDVALGRLDTGDRTGAIAAAGRATELDPDAVGAWTLLGDLLAGEPALGAGVEAPAAYRRAIELDPADPTLRLRLAEAYAALALYAETEAAYRSAIDVGADGPGVWLAVARSIVDQGRPAEAIEAFSRVVEAAPDLAVARLERGQALFNANRLEEAMIDIRLAIEMAPDDLEALFTATRTLMVMGDMDAAVELAERAVATGREPARTRTNLGRLLLRQNRPAEAVAPLEAAVAAAPDLIEARYLLGQALMATGATERGQALLAEYQAALREQRNAEAQAMRDRLLDRAGVHLLRGRVFHAEGRHEEAREQLDAAVDLQPDAAEAWDLLAEVYAALGRPADAARARERAAEAR